MSRKIHGRSAFRRLMRLEALERREVLAGNVTATVAGTTLIVRGDVNDNTIAIVETDPGRYAVVGLEADGDGGTTINNGNNPGGEDFFQTPLGRVIRSITVDLGRGDDTLGVGNDGAAFETLVLDAGLDLTADLGLAAGDINAAIGVVVGADPFSLAGNLTIVAGDGSDFIGIVAENIGGSVIANLGRAAGGFNGLGIDGSSIADGTTIGGSVSIVGGVDDDGIIVRDAFIRGALTAALSNGQNATVAVAEAVGLSFRSASITGGARFDAVTIVGQENPAAIATISLGNGGSEVLVDDSVLRNLTIATGTGEDTVNLGGGVGLEIGLNLMVSTGNGNDDVTAFANVGSNVTVNTGAGSDYVELAGAGVVLRLARNVSVVTGNDADGVNIHDALIQGNLTINTGNGNDSNLEQVGVAGADGGVVLNLLQVAGALSVLTGAGEDTVNVQTIQVNRNATLDTGANDDDVIIDEAIVLLNFYARLGAGNDELDITNSTAVRAYLYGGAGNNDRGDATNVDVDFLFNTQFEDGNLS